MEAKIFSECSVPGMPYWRKRKGWSQTDLADALEVSRGTIGRYESGSRHVKVPMLRRAAQVLDCTVTDLVTASQETLADA